MDIYTLNATDILERLIQLSSYTQWGSQYITAWPDGENLLGKSLLTICDIRIIILKI